MSALKRCALVSEVQCASLSRGICRPTCIHVATRHTCGGQQARGTSDYKGPFYDECGVGGKPVSSPGARRGRFPCGGGVDGATWAPPSLGPLHDRPTTPDGGFGARTKSCALSVASIAVLGGDDIGRWASFRLDHHRGSGCHGATRLCSSRHLTGQTGLGSVSSSCLISSCYRINVQNYLHQGDSYRVHSCLPLYPILWQ